MSLSLGSVLYVPPPTAYPHAAAILENLRRFPAKHPLLLYSEHDHGWPGQVKLLGDPEAVKRLKTSQGQSNKWALNNALFLTGLRVALKNGLTHVLYLEADCRVGADGWDEAIFTEYFNLGFPCIAAGTLATYNPCNWSREAALRWESLVRTNRRKNVPVATYGWKGAGEKHPSCVFPNGALSVLDLAWMAKLFDTENTMNEALNSGPWDMELGMRVWQLFEIQAYTVMGLLTTIYSGYGDVLTTEDERMNWLRSGEYLAVHQIKSGQQY